jgi:signal transduction histidine kinase
MIIENARSGGDRLDRLANLIQTSADEALRFIQHYLEQWAEGELKRRFVLESVALGKLAQEAISMLEAAAGVRRINLELRVSGDDSVRLDRIATRHAMENLLSNAIKYGPTDATVDVVVDAGSPGTIRFSVLDRGPGLSSTDQKRLFERYVRLGDGVARTDSNGLGLAIAKREITQLGGHLWFEPREGGGAIFAFELPLAGPEA